MKKLLLFALALPVFGFSQVQTTTMAGDFYNPLIWDCLCLPADGDQLVINHAVVMNLSIYYTSGSITVSPSGSLMEDATDRDFWANGGTFTNAGDFKAHNVAVSAGGTISNLGAFISIDSILNQGTMNNSGVIGVFDILNDEMASFINNGDLNIVNNFNNQGLFYSGGTISVGNDFSNCNTQTMDAIFTNDGIFCITNDFSNCIDDTLTGSGDYFIGGSSANVGVFDGTHTFHTPSGTIGIPGDIQPGVTVTTGSCNLSVQSNDVLEFTVYPNPTSSDLQLSITGAKYHLVDISGKIVQEGFVQNYSIDLEKIEQGVYMLQLEGAIAKRIVKQ